MAEVTAQLVKELREMTQAGMMDCKKALLENGGDMEKAVEWLREKGLAAAAKKAGRIAAEGMVAGYVTDDAKIGVIVEVNCETDFVANTDNFKDFCKKIAHHIAKANPADVDALMGQQFAGDISKTITDLVSDATVAIGEKISVRRFARYEAKAGVVETYIHMGGKIGVLLEVDNNKPETYTNEVFKTYYHDLTLQIAAARPSYVLKHEVPTDKLDKEKEILRAQALNEGKPEKIVDKIVAGRLLAVVIAVIFQLQSQRLPGGLVFNTAKQGGRPMKQIAKLKVPGNASKTTAVAERFLQTAKRIFDVAAFRHIAPANT